MRYWNALAFCQYHLTTTQFVPVSLDVFSTALSCTRRNAQLLIKRLVKEEVIEWQPGIGRGNHPKAKRLKCLAQRIEVQAHRCLEQGQIEDAIALIHSEKRNQFLSEYLAQYQATPSKAHILQVPFYRGTHSLDPITINRRTEQHIASYLYARLLKQDSHSNGFEGDLAHSWLHRGDTLSIVLRKNLTFHDGSPLLAADVKAHFERLMASSSSSVALFSYIDSVVVDGDYRITFRSNTMPSLLPKLLAHGAMGICKMVGGTLYGSGSFILKTQTEWQTTLTCNPRYHGFRPWLDGIEIWNIGDKAKTFELNSDVVHGSHLKHSRKGFIRHQQWERGCVHSMLNPKRHTWMRSLKHRQYLQQIITSMPEPRGLDCEKLATATGMMSAPKPIVSQMAYIERFNIAPPCEALTVLTYQLGTHIASAKRLVETLQQVGVPCELEVVEYPIFNQLTTLASADIIVTGEVFSDDIEMSWLGWLLATRSNDACYTSNDRIWLNENIQRVMQFESDADKHSAFESLERALIDKGIYQPMYHVEQDLNVSENVSTPELLANGWIDFNQVTL